MLPRLGGSEKIAKSDKWGNALSSGGSRSITADAWRRSLQLGFQV
jgi:hypothetical protein